MRKLPRIIKSKDHTIWDWNNQGYRNKDGKSWWFGHSGMQTQRRNGVIYNGTYPRDKQLAKFRTAWKTSVEPSHHKHQFPFATKAKRDFSPRCKKVRKHHNRYEYEQKG